MRSISYGLEMELVLLGLRFGELGEALFEGGGELRILRLEPGEIVGEGDVLLLEESTGLLGSDGGGVGLRLDDLDLAVEIADEGIGPLRDEPRVAGAPLEFLVREEERHRSPRRR